MSKQREFWILGYDHIGKYSHAYSSVTDSPGIAENMIHVRQVSPEYDRAVEGLVEAAKKIKHKMSSSPKNTVSAPCSRTCPACSMNKALANFAKAREGE